MTAFVLPILVISVLFALIYYVFRAIRKEVEEGETLLTFLLVLLGISNPRT